MAQYHEKYIGKCLLIVLINVSFLLAPISVVLVFYYDFYHHQVTISWRLWGLWWVGPEVTQSKKGQALPVGHDTVHHAVWRVHIWCENDRAQSLLRCQLPGQLCGKPSLTPPVPADYTHHFPTSPTSLLCLHLRHLCCSVHTLLSGSGPQPQSTVQVPLSCKLHMQSKVQALVPTSKLSACIEIFGKQVQKSALQGFLLHIPVSEALSIYLGTHLMPPTWLLIALLTHDT